MLGWRKWPSSNLVVTWKPGLIAPLSKTVRKKRKYRVVTYGEVMKRSEFQPRFWLVKFSTGASFYVTEKVVDFVDNVTPASFILYPDKDNKISLKEIDRSVVDEEAIIKVIMCSKMHNIPGHPKLSYSTLLNLFKDKFEWLTIGKLRYHGDKMKGKIDNICKDSWLNVLEESEVESCPSEASVNDSIIVVESDPKKVSTPTHESNKRTKDVDFYDDDGIPASVAIRRKLRAKRMKLIHRYDSLFSDDDSSSDNESEGSFNIEKDSKYIYIQLLYLLLRP